MAATVEVEVVEPVVGTIAAAAFFLILPALPAAVALVAVMVR